MKLSRRRRVSRALILVLGIFLALGLIFWLHNVSKNAAVRSALQAASQSSASPARESNTPEKTEPKTLVLQTPTAPVVAATTQPIEQPAAPVILAAATTAPAVVAIQAGPERSAGPDQPARQAAFKPSPTTQAKLPDDFLLCGTTAAMETDKMFDARRALNAAIVANSLAPADLAKAKQTLNEINAKVVFSTQHFPHDEFGGTYEVPSGAVLSKIASSHEVTAELLQRINGISDPRKLRAGQTIKVLKGPFHAAVYKKDFRLEVWLGAPDEKGSMYITTFPVGLGKDDSTPTGAWAVGARLKNPAYYSPRGEGVIDPDDPQNPLGEYWITLIGTDGAAIGKTSYGIHGTIRPESIGKQESMGCIRLKNEDAALVYEMLIEGQSTVVVRD